LTAAALALGPPSGLAVALWLAAEASPALTAEAYDVSLASRLAVAAQGSAIVRDHPLLGTGLGSWLPAFRPYQAPPVEGGIWDHAHNDYLELAAETGVAGMVLVLLFAVAILRAAGGQQPSRVEEARGRPDEPAPEDLRRFALPVWRAALAERTGLRWGLAGGVAAILAHSLVDFGLHMPANSLALMIVVGLLVLSGRPQPAGGTPALAVLLVLLTAAAGPQVANGARRLAGASPISPRDCLAEADLLFAEAGDGARARALVLRALDSSPADLEGHEALAVAVGPGAAASRGWRTTWPRRSAAASTGRSSLPPAKSARRSWRTSSPCSRHGAIGRKRRPPCRPKRRAARRAEASWRGPQGTISRRAIWEPPNGRCGPPCSRRRNGATSTARSRSTFTRPAATSRRRRACSTRASATRSTCCPSTRASRRCWPGAKRRGSRRWRVLRPHPAPPTTRRSCREHPGCRPRAS